MHTSILSFKQMECQSLNVVLQYHNLLLICVEDSYLSSSEIVSLLTDDAGL